jgi:transcriptional repressor of dcmA and dcmR
VATEVITSQPGSILGNPLRPQEIADSNELLDIGRAAALLNVSETSLRRWTNSGRLPCLRVGQRRERRFRRGDLLAFLEGRPSDISPHTGDAARQKISSLSEGPVTLTFGSHLCGLYASDLGRITLAHPFLLAGLNEGSVCFLVGPVTTHRQVLKFLRKSRPSLDADIYAGRLLLSEYHPGTRGQNKYFRALLDKMAAEGAQSFRIIGDMWGMRSKSSAAALIQYEADYDQLIARNYPVVTLCIYDVRKFSGVEVLSTLKGHRDILRYPLEKVLA